MSVDCWLTLSMETLQFHQHQFDKKREEGKSASPRLFVCFVCRRNQFDPSAGDVWRGIDQADPPEEKQSNRRLRRSAAERGTSRRSASSSSALMIVQIAFRCFCRVRPSLSGWEDFFKAKIKEDQKNFSNRKQEEEKNIIIIIICTTFSIISQASRCDGEKKEKEKTINSYFKMECRLCGEESHLTKDRKVRHDRPRNERGVTMSEWNDISR